jgi:5-methylcytosine-specific restriction protein A
MRTPQLCGNDQKPKCLKKAVKRGRCEDHQIKPFAGAEDLWKAQRPKGWEKVRLKFIKDNGGMCASCGALNSRHVDHIKNLSEGGSWERENLQVLCAPCHRTKTAKEAARGRARKRSS